MNNVCASNKFPSQLFEHFRCENKVLFGDSEQVDLLLKIVNLKDDEARQVALISFDRAKQLSDTITRILNHLKELGLVNY